MSDRVGGDDGQSIRPQVPIAWSIEETATLLEAALNGVQTPFAVLDLDRQRVRCNYEYLRLFELTEDELTTRGVAAVEDAGARLIENAPDVRRFWERPPDRDYHDVLHFRDGRTFERVVTPFRLQGHSAGQVATYRDITASVASERELATSRAMLERAQQVAHIGSWVREHATGTLEWTPESRRIFGLPSELYPRSADEFLQYVHPEDRDIVKAAIAEATNGDGYDIEHRLLRPDGQVVWVHQRADSERDADGNLRRTVGTIQDVTGRRRLEDQLRQAQKLEAIGRLAGGVAHDLNNALTAIVGYTELAIAALSGEHPARADVLEIRRAAERAEAVTRQLLAFSRKQPLKPRVFSLAGTIGPLCRMLQRFLGPRIELVIDIAPAVDPICGDPAQLEQAIVNLAVNAKDAMPDGGAIAIRLGMTRVEAAAASIPEPIPPGGYVSLSIRDTGTGMPPDVLAHIFEPFFTTKDAGQGTGLGLAMVYGTVKQINGYIAVDSVAGQGTTFTLLFPPAEDAETSGSDSPSVALPLSREPVILIVEDETAVRNLVHLSLANRGYRVLTAASGDQALALMGEEPVIDLLLTDANMPGMSGIDLVRQALQARPDLRVIVMSGFTEDLPRLAELEKHVTLLSKPFTPREIRERVDRHFGRR